MHTEDDLLPISALQHLLFCERQTALIHIERLWVENRLTAEGRLLHKKTDNAKSETRDGVRITRSLPVHSFRLGVYGVCDVVNFRPPTLTHYSEQSLARCVQQELKKVRQRTVNPVRIEEAEAGHRQGSPFQDWQIVPVEYKRGQPKKSAADRVQVCAQAMCLEEMLGIRIPEVQLFYGKQQRRTVVATSDDLRQLTIHTAAQLHALIAAGNTPPATREPKCESCSLFPVCMPMESPGHLASKYIKRMLQE